ncbi:MAG: hypothetical protein HYX92_19370 [Chloroflexi bacterium]|nr:hypothetical protein [Chloroflexota bacterium]
MAMVLEGFEGRARMEAELLGLPDLRIVVLTRDMTQGKLYTVVDHEQIRTVTETITPTLLDLLEGVR